MLRYISLFCIIFFSVFTSFSQNNKSSNSSSKSALANALSKKMAGTMGNSNSAKSTVFATPEIVDLGLSVCWGSFNLGASKDIERGSFFSWGDPAPKTRFSWKTEKYGTEEHDEVIGGGIDKDGFEQPQRVVHIPEKWISIGDDIAGTEYDAAHVNLGGNWRMPTEKEFLELMDPNNCTWEYTKKNGVPGAKVTGPNGNWIFLPATGQGYKNDFIEYSDIELFYWTSTLFDEASAKSTSILYLGQRMQIQTYYTYRWFGMPIRPVYQKESTRPNADADNNLKGKSVDDEGAEGAQPKSSAQPIELLETLYDKTTDIRLDYRSSGGNIKLFENPEIMSQVTEMYVNFNKIPVTNNINTDEGIYVVILKTNGIKEIPKNTFCNLNGAAGSGTLLQMFYPASVEKIGADNGTGCSYCSDIYFYSSKAPKGPSLMGGYIFKNMEPQSEIGAKAHNRKVHILSEAEKSFTGLKANVSYFVLLKDCQFEIEKM